MTADFDAQMRAVKDRQAKAQPGFDQWREFLGLREYGLGCLAFRRVKEACWAVLEYRRAHNQQEGWSGEQQVIAVRVAADTFAQQIEDAARGADLDGHTVRTIVAGLRCPQAPYCTGCPACQTVTAPERANVRVRGLFE